MPVRIKLSRAKGWRKPEGVVVVARPTRWGNPFPVATLGRRLAVDMFRDLLNGVFLPHKLDHLTAAEFGEVAAAREAFIKRLGQHPAEAVKALRGRDVGCWCGLDEECHGDPILEAANR